MKRPQFSLALPWNRPIKAIYKHLLTGGMSKACHRANRARANQVIGGPIQPSIFVQKYSGEVDSDSGFGPASEVGTRGLQKFLHPTGFCDATLGDRVRLLLAVIRMKQIDRVQAVQAVLDVVESLRAGLFGFAEDERYTRVVHEARRRKLYPIQNEADHADAKRLVEKLMGSSDSQDRARMVAQARLIEAYERTQWPRTAPALPLLLSYLMDQHNL
jgi:hypothetical protein